MLTETLKTRIKNILDNGDPDIPKKGNIDKRTYILANETLTLTLGNRCVYISSLEKLIAKVSEIRDSEFYFYLADKIENGVSDISSIPEEDLLSKRNILSVTEFSRLFTPDEYKAFKLEVEKSTTDRQAFITFWLDVSEGLEWIDLKSPDVVSFLTGLELMGIITTARKNEILGN